MRTEKEKTETAKPEKWNIDDDERNDAQTFLLWESVQHDKYCFKFQEKFDEFIKEFKVYSDKQDYLYKLLAHKTNAIHYRADGERLWMTVTDWGELIIKEGGYKKAEIKAKWDNRLIRTWPVAISIISAIIALLALFTEIKCNGEKEKIGTEIGCHR